MTLPRPASTAERPAVPVLVLGKGITSLGVVRALGRRGVPLYVTGAGRDLVTSSRWYRPLPGAGVEEAAAADLGKALASLEIPRLVLLPCSDGWAVAVSRLAPDLAARFPAGVAPASALERLVDKGRFAETLKELGLPHPRTFLLRDDGALESVPEDWFLRSFLKPANSSRFSGAYGVKAVRPSSREDARAIVAKAREKGLEMMLQEFLPGPPTRHVFLDGFVDRRGRVCGMLARRRLRMFPADFGNSTYTESIRLSDIRPAERDLRRLFEAIGYRGVFSAEFKLDARDDQYKLLEVNARPWWFVSFAAACGVDVCDMAVRDALGEEVALVTEYAVGRRCVYGRRDLETRRVSPGPDRPSLASLLRSWIGADQLTLTADDPGPGLREIAAWTRSRLRGKLPW